MPLPLFLHEIVALSRARLESIPLRSSDAVISISSPDERQKVIAPPIITGAGAILWLCFHDVTEPLETDHGIWMPVQPHHAQAILSFLSRLPHTMVRLFIHCEEGRSRSVGVLEALRPLFPEAHLFCPDRRPGDEGNLYVKHLLSQCSLNTDIHGTILAQSRHPRRFVSHETVATTEDL